MPVPPALSFTAPAYYASGGCSAGEQVIPQNGLRWGRLYGRPLGGSEIELLRFPLAGMEGQQVTIPTPTLSESWELWVTTEGWSGVVSCPSNTITLIFPPEPVAAPLPAEPLHEVWYDLAGRRIQKPTRSGMYFMRRGSQAPRKITYVK